MTKYKLHKPYKIIHRSHIPPKRSSLITQGKSGEELDLLKSLQSEFPYVKMYSGDRTILESREIDIWIPSLKIGIEYNGNRYHSSAMDKDKYYHLQKTILGEQKGVKIVHIFSDMWENKRSQTLDLIKKIIGKAQVIESDKCLVSKIPVKEGQEFWNAFNVNDHDNRVTSYIGIFYKEQLVAVLAYSDDTIYGYQDIRGIKINNGIKLILDKYPELKNYSIHANRSLLEQDLWVNEGFKSVSCTEPRLFYTKDFKQRIPESLVKDKSGYYEIYDCGEIILQRL